MGVVLGIRVGVVLGLCWGFLLASCWGSVLESYSRCAGDSCRGPAADSCWGRARVVLGMFAGVMKKHVGIFAGLKFCLPTIQETLKKSVRASDLQTAAGECLNIMLHTKPQEKKQQRRVAKKGSRVPRKNTTTTATQQPVPPVPPLLPGVISKSIQRRAKKALK